MKSKQLSVKGNHLEESLVDLGVATEDKVDRTQIWNEKIMEI